MSVLKREQQLQPQNTSIQYFLIEVVSPLGAFAVCVISIVRIRLILT
jgi:hypothetical protein